MEATASIGTVPSHIAAAGGRAAFLSTCRTICCIAAPALLALSSLVLEIDEPLGALGGALGTYSLTLWIGVLMTMAWILVPFAPRFSVAAAALGSLGAVGGTNFFFIGIVHQALITAGAPERPFIETVMRFPLPVALVTNCIGPPLFPLSLLLFAVALMRFRLIRPWMGILLALGAAAFPAGRISGNVVFVHAADILLLAAMIPIALKLRRMGLERRA